MRAFYSSIVQEIKSKGVKVIHKELPDHGEYDANNNIIRIDKILKNTFLGCIILYHEYHHALDFRNDRNKRFYYTNMAKSTMDRDKKIEIIWKVEWGCFNYALNRLKKYGVTPKDHEFLQKDWVKENLLYLWVKEYLEE